jgi:hypothetical protein
MIPIDMIVQGAVGGLAIARDLRRAWQLRRKGSNGDKDATRKAPLGREPPGPVPAGWDRWNGARPEPRGAPANSILAVPGLSSTTPAFRAELLALAEELGIPVDSLAVVISSESRFNPKALNPLPAAGLIQLTVGARLPSYDTKEAIRGVLNLAPVEQVRQVVRPYYQRMSAAKGANPGHLYMLNFLPHRAGQPEDTVLGRKDAAGFEGAVYRENSGFDRAKKGTITIGDVYAAAAAIAHASHGQRIAVDGSVLPPLPPAQGGRAAPQTPPAPKVAPQTPAAPPASPAAPPAPLNSAQALQSPPAPSPGAPVLPAPPAPQPKAGRDPRRPDSARGLLLAAVQRGELLPILWVPVRVGELEIRVTSDALRAPVPELGEAAARLPVSYAEQTIIARALDALPFTQPWWDAAFAVAQIKLAPEPLPAGPSMGSLEYSVRYSRSVDAAIERAGGRPGQLVRDVGKGWILHPRLAETGAVNYGWIQPGTLKPIQTPGARHDPTHQDYSQTCVLVHRTARLLAGGTVDLLELLRQQGMPATFLDVYR